MRGTWVVASWAAHLGEEKKQYPWGVLGFMLVWSGPCFHQPLCWVQKKLLSTFGSRWGRGVNICTSGFLEYIPDVYSLPFRCTGMSRCCLCYTWDSTKKPTFPTQAQLRVAQLLDDTAAASLCAWGCLFTPTFPLHCFPNWLPVSSDAFVLASKIGVCHMSHLWSLCSWYSLLFSDFFRA